MRRVRYSVAASLDGYIASRSGGYDWIVREPGIDFSAFFRQIDTVLMGRKTFEVAQAQKPAPPMPGAPYVFSRSLRPQDHPDVTVVGDSAESTVAALREQDGKDIWLMGGGVLFRSLLEAGLVDSLEVGVQPVLLGGGIPLLPPTARTTRLDLVREERFRSGILLLRYDVRPG